MRIEDPAQRLSEVLRHDIGALGALPETPAGRRCARRLADLAAHAPPFLALLVEPLLERVAPDVADATLLACARVHLYARVLDDALDENLPLDRRNLLRIQPLYWRAVHALGAAHPRHAEAAAALVAATVAAAESDDDSVDPPAWGRKNFHLLLAPLLLSGDSAAFRAALPGLESVLALAQAREEAAQGRLHRPGAHAALAACLPRWLDPERVAVLHERGWRGAAERFVADGEALFSTLKHSTISV